MKFSDYNINKLTLQAIAQIGHTEPTEIQKLTLPILLDQESTQRDFVGQAQTGTGKTAAFVIPLLEKIDLKLTNVQAIILAPTRELANQITIEVEKLAAFSKIKVVSIYGGVSYDKQIRSLRLDRPQIVVGTPGRVIDLIDKGLLKLKDARQVIVDEADEMLNMGFLEDVKLIIEALDEKRSIWLFSATMPRAISLLIEKNFNNPQFVQVKTKTLSNENISQFFCTLKRKDFAPALRRIVQAHEDMYGIVFCERKSDTEALAQELDQEGIDVALLNGDLSQGQRDMAMDKFRNKKANLLICTDVASRGIDVKDITHVFNFGLPRNLDSYVHRIGRTGRAQTKGQSITFVTPLEQKSIRRLENFTKATIRPYTFPSLEIIKQKKITKELENLQFLKDALITKQDGFKIDDSFQFFKPFFEDLSMEQSLKIIFSWKFQKEFQSLNQSPLSVISTTSSYSNNSRDRDSSYSSSSSGSRSRSRSSNYGGGSSGGGSRRY